MFELDTAALLLCLAVAAGGFTQSASGFGLALVAIPIAAAVIPLKEAAPLMNLFGVLVSLEGVLRHRQHVLWREVFALLAVSLPGVALGVLLLRYGDTHLLTKGLGLFVLCYALHALWRESHAVTAPPRAPHGLLAGVAGFLAGFFGGASSLNGPPVIVYATWQRWPKECFKGTIQSFFLFNNLLICGGYLAAGVITPSVCRWIWITLPALALGTIAGAWFSRRLNAHRFRQFVLALSVLVGLSLLLR